MKLITIFFSVIVSSNVFATEWKTETVDEGNVTVTSRVYSEKNDEGKKIQILEYSAEMVTDASYENVVSTLLDITKHKDFLDGAKESKMLSSNDETALVYYYLNAPWPMPDADCVSAMQYTRNDSQFEMVLESKPDAIEKTKVKRMSLYNATYTVDKVADGARIKTYYKLSPVAKAPKFLVKTWFPNGPADIVKRIANLSN